MKFTTKSEYNVRQKNRKYHSKNFIYAINEGLTNIVKKKLNKDTDIMTLPKIL